MCIPVEVEYAYIHILWGFLIGILISSSELSVPPFQERPNALEADV